MLSAISFIHNGLAHDYCFREAIGAALAIADEVIVLEAGSTDGTWAALQSMAAENPRLRLLQGPWNPAPLTRNPDTDWLRDLANTALAHVSHPYYIYFQGDELFDPRDREEIRARAAAGLPCSVHRYNFWGDPWHITPPGRVCGHYICRMAPARLLIGWGNEVIDAPRPVPTHVGLYHYGFLRNPAAFRRKAEIMLPTHAFGGMDPVVLRAEAENDIRVLTQAWPMTERLPFKGTHPREAHAWLRERGFDPVNR